MSIQFLCRFDARAIVFDWTKINRWQRCFKIWTKQKWNWIDIENNGEWCIATTSVLPPLFLRVFFSTYYARLQLNFIRMPSSDDFAFCVFVPSVLRHKLNTETKRLRIFLLLPFSFTSREFQECFFCAAALQSSVFGGSADDGLVLHKFNGQFQSK